MAKHRKIPKTTELHNVLRLPPASDAASAPIPLSYTAKRKPRPNTQTKALCVYDYCTNVRKTLRLARGDLNDSVHCYKNRKQSDRFRRFPIEDLLKRDKLNLDLFWLKDDSLEDIENLPEPNVLAAEIVETLEAALEQFRSVTAELANDAVME